MVQYGCYYLAKAYTKHCDSDLQSLSRLKFKIVMQCTKLVKDSSGNANLFYPITKADNVDGLEEALATKADASHGTHVAFILLRPQSLAMLVLLLNLFLLGLSEPILKPLVLLALIELPT